MGLSKGRAPLAGEVEVTEKWRPMKRRMAITEGEKKERERTQRESAFWGL